MRFCKVTLKHHDPVRLLLMTPLKKVLLRSQFCWLPIFCLFPFRSTTIELRRKLDDSQAALHELGRENQSIQVELAKQSGRKWADDSEANNCILCTTQFTITNRKHHCRNCGQIFCAECSSKKATMSNFKNPQRVCDNCYAEIQQSKWQLGNPNSIGRSRSQMEHSLAATSNMENSTAAAMVTAGAASIDRGSHSSSRSDHRNSSLWDEQVH